MRDANGRFVKGHKPGPKTQKQLEAAINNISAFKDGSHRIGKKHSDEARKKMSEKHKQNISQMSDEERKKRFGVWVGKTKEQHPNYIEDRTLLKKENRHGDSAYQDWRMNVYKRDNYKCKINNCCNGRIEAHHILPWREYSEFRYDVNNGITLCHSHHPRGREEEKRLIQTFKELVTASSD